jgi:hypothetical protein
MDSAWGRTFNDSLRDSEVVEFIHCVLRKLLTQRVHLAAIAFHQEHWEPGSRQPLRLKALPWEVSGKNMCQLIWPILFKFDQVEIL